MHKKELITVNLADHKIELTPANCLDQIHKLATTSAHDALGELGLNKTVELAFALLEHYFSLVYIRSCPIIDCPAPEKLQHAIDALSHIITSCGIEFETSITALKK